MEDVEKSLVSQLDKMDMCRPCVATKSHEIRELWGDLRQQEEDIVVVLADKTNSPKVVGKGLCAQNGWCNTCTKCGNVV